MAASEERYLRHRAVRCKTSAGYALPDYKETRSFAPETYPANRVCAHDGCDTVLSRYNPSSYCDVHADEQYDPRTVAMDYSEDGLRTCPSCGRRFIPNLNNWYSDTRSKDGLSAECIACLNPERGEREHARQLRDRRKYAGRRGQVAS